MKSVPPAAASKTPGRSATEPVYEPRTEPKSAACEQRLGHRRAVERDERPPAARERVQDLAHEEVLARAGRARHEERQRRRRERRDPAPAARASRRVRPQKNRPVESGASRSARTRLTTRTRPSPGRLVLAHRVRERVGAQAARLVLERDVLVRRRQDDGQVRRAAAQALEDVEALAVAPVAALALPRRRLAERLPVRQELLVGDVEAQVEDDGVGQAPGARERGLGLGPARGEGLRRRTGRRGRGPARTSGTAPPCGAGRRRRGAAARPSRAAPAPPRPPSGRRTSGPSSTATRR